MNKFLIVLIQHCIFFIYYNIIFKNATIDFILIVIKVNLQMRHNYWIFNEVYKRTLKEGEFGKIKTIYKYIGKAYFY